MCPSLWKSCCPAVLAIFLASSGWAFPLGSRLLPLVPPGAEIVAGFENHPDANGRLLLTTRNNRLDLDDFQALTGSDSKRVFDEVIEVAAAAQDGLLSEHMLLVAGRLDRERIFRSIEESGAKSVEFLGERILLIRPFARERGDMLETRWLAILDGRIAILGTPKLVQKALRRYADHAVPDSVLEERLSLLHHDVTSWNVLLGTKKRDHKMNFARPFTAWAQLEQDADVLMVAVRFGSKIRVDFSIHADAGEGPEFFTRKAEVFTDALSRPHPDAKPTDAPEHRLASFVIEPNRAQGSLELSNKEFAAWCDHLYMVRAGITPPATNGD